MALLDNLKNLSSHYFVFPDCNMAWESSKSSIKFQVYLFLDCTIMPLFCLSFLSPILRSFKGYYKLFKNNKNYLLCFIQRLLSYFLQTLNCVKPLFYSITWFLWTIQLNYFLRWNRTAILKTLKSFIQVKICSR